MAKVEQLPVIVLGAGPVGLAAAAHLRERQQSFLVLEASQDVGASFASVAHVRLFSPWHLNIDAAAVRLLESSGWAAPSRDDLPRAGELRERYLKPLAAALNGRIRYGACVVAISRAAFDKVKSRRRERAPFLVRFETARGAEELLARAVIDATGTWSQPNPIGASGIPAWGEQAARAQIEYGIPDVLETARSRYLGKRVAVVGSGHSAAASLIALSQLVKADPATSIVWLVRGTNMRRVFGGGARDELAERGNIGTALERLTESGVIELRRNFYVEQVAREGERLTLIGSDADGVEARVDQLDEIIAATGSRPDLSLARELRVKLDPWLESTELLAPLIDPNIHSCGSVPPHGHRELAHPEQDYFAVGAKSYGRAPNFLLATGYEQVRSVVARLAGDLEAADTVQLSLPETGVCSADLVDDDVPVSPPTAGCCPGPAARPTQEAKAGCCSPAAAVESKQARATKGSGGCCG
jgi:thioredoxin reductase